jgi:hypothetical protein
MGHARNKNEWVVLDRLSDLILRGVEGCVVDIGIGYSTVVLAKHAAKFDREQYSCDYDQAVIDKYIPEKKLHPRHIVVYAKVSDFLVSFREKPALVFIDGFHCYDDVIGQVDYLLQLMSFGGVIFLHDTCPPLKFVRLDGSRCGDVFRVRTSLEARKDVCTFTWPYKFQAQGCGLTMAMKWTGA